MRAPNIFELFSPDQSVTFRPFDPCEQAAIDTLVAAGDPRGANRAANCAADGVPAGFQDPLSARFSGVQSGNANLSEETADTYTFGVVLQPRFADGLTISVDYWDIEIADAIAAVGGQDIVDNCYDTGGFPNGFCGLFTRNRDTTSPQFLGLNFIRQTQVNFGALESNGVDFSANYEFDALGATWAGGLSGTWVDELNEFFDPGDPTAVDPELGEIQRPELAARLNLDFSYAGLFVRWQTTYQDEQALVSIEDIGTVYDGRAVEDEVIFHDLSLSYDFTEELQVYGGIQNVTDEQPFFSEQAWPVSPLGRYFFVGLSVQR